jgi:hypothetical protein
MRVGGALRRFGGGHASLLWTPQNDIDLYGGEWWDCKDQPAGSVTDWISRCGKGQPISQATGAAKPTKSGSGTGETINFDGGDSLQTANNKNLLQVVKMATCPDDATTAASVNAGNGGVCCGLAAQPGTTDQFWTLTYGPFNSGDAGRNPSAILFRYNRVAGTTTKLKEIVLKPLYPNISGMQGICVDPDDNTLWGACAEGSMAGQVIHFSQNGAVLTSNITASWPANGIAIQPAFSDARGTSPKKMWISEESSQGTNIESRSMVDGTIVNTAVAGIAAQDMLFFDTATQSLLLTYGVNGATQNVKVYTTSGTTGALVASGFMTFVSTIGGPVDAIEGMVWANDRFYIVQDRNYHVSSSVPNVFSECVGTPPVSTKLSVHLTAAVSATTGTDCFLEVGTGTSGPLDGNGFGVYPASTTTLSIFANTGASGTTQQGGLTAQVVPAMTSLRLIDILFDTVAGTGTLYVDGTLVNTFSLANLRGGIPNAGTMSLSTALGSARNITGDIRDVIFITGASDRVKMEGYRAARWGLQGNLPAQHLWKSAAPTP